MAADRLNRDIPSFDGMAGVAIRPELAAVNVCVAIGAFLADVGENQLHVALRALHLFVHATQGVMRFVVVKLRNAANRLPTQGCMAVLARHVQPGTVRIAGDAVLCLRKSRTRRVRLNNGRQNAELQHSPEHGVAPSPFPKSSTGLLTG